MQALRAVARAAKEGARRAFRTRDALIAWALGATVLLSMSVCIVPFVLGTFVLGRAVQRANRAPHRSHNTTIFAGLATVAVLAAPGLAVFVAKSLVPDRDEMGFWGMAAILVIVPVFGLLSGPFLTVGPHIMRRGLGLDDALGRSLAGAMATGTAQVALRGLAVGLVLSVAPATFIAAVMLSSASLGGALPLIALCTLPPLGLAWVVGFASACAGQDEERLADAASPTAPVRLLLAPLVAMGFVLVATLLAAASPLAPWQERPPTPLTCEPALEDYGPHALSVHPGSNRRSFLVETADGGGAGVIEDVPQNATSEVCLDGPGVVWLAWEPSPRDAPYGVALRSHFVPIDERGVRLDDGIGDRLAVRGGVPVAVLLGLGLCLLAIGLRELARRAALSDLVGRADHALRTARGRVVLSDASIEPSGRVRGSARFISSDGTHAFALPPKVRLVGPHGVMDRDTPALLVATERLDSLGLREGTARWPESAILIVGQTEDARRAVTTELSRVVGLWAAAATCSFALAAIALLLAL